MKEESYILIQHFCETTLVDPEFIEQLLEYGLIQHVVQGNEPAVHQEELPVLERMVRLHYDLDINLEGLQVIAHMRQKMIRMQKEMLELERKLKRFE